jgi:hypothetical protein
LPLLPLLVSAAVGASLSSQPKRVTEIFIISTVQKKMNKYLFVFSMSLIVLASCNNQPGSDDLISVKGRFIKIMRADNNLSKVILKLKNDSLAIFKTTMRVDDTNIELFKNGGMDIEVIYQEYKNPATNTTDKIAQSIHPIYVLRR